MVGKKLLSHSLIYGLASLLINGMNFFLIPFYTHYLTTSEYGIISSVTLFSTTATAVLTFGLNGAITRFYVDYSQEDFKVFLFSAFVAQITVAAAIAGIFFLFNGLFLDHLFSNVPYDPYLKYGIWIGLTGIFSTIPLAFLQAKTKALLYRIFTSVSFFLLTSFMILFVVINRQGSIGGIRASLFANLLMAATFSVFILRESKAKFKLEYVITAFTFGLPVMIYTVFGTLQDVSSKYFVERYISLSQLGIYNVSNQIASLILLISNAINMAWLPIFFAEAKREETSPVFAQFGKLLIFFLSTLGLTVALFSKELVTLFMPVSYASAAGYIPYFVLIYAIGNGYWTLMVNPITYSRKTIYLPMVSILSGLSAVSANLVLVPRLGVMGAVYSAMIGYLTIVVVAYFIFRKHSAVRYNFGKMNWIVIIAASVYLLSTLLAVDNFLATVTIKIGLVFLFGLCLHFLKVYSWTDIRNFVKSQIT